MKCLGMNPPLDQILPLLNAQCGDVLKAALLHIYFPDMPKLNPLWLKSPTGDVEAAFAAMKRAVEPPSKSDELLAAFKADHVPIEDKNSLRPVDPVVQKLIEASSTAKTVKQMPEGIRFDDVESSDPPAKPHAVKPEVSVDGEFITLEAAMSEFNYSYAGISLRLKNAGIEGVRRPGEGRAKYFPRNRVAEVCGAKGKHVR